MDTKQLVRIARLYYEFKYKQDEIAQMENISRAKVSRLLEKAEKEGIVQIKVVYPLQTVHELGEKLREHFNLKKVFVIPVIINHPEAVRNDLGKAVNKFLGEIVQDGDVIGVSWGTTLSSVVNNLDLYDYKNISVVQLNGGVTKNYLSTQSGAIVEGFIKSFQAVPFMLPAPTIVDDVDLAKAISEDSNVKQTLELAKKARIALFGIGRAGYNSILVQAGYFENEEYEELLDKGAVGDICSRYFSIDGHIVDDQLNMRTVSIGLKDLINKEYSIAIANGEEKAEAIIGALKGQYINTLFADEAAVKRCLEILDIDF